MKKAGVAHKVDFREGPAGPILDGLIAAADGASDEGSFDFAFVDADKVFPSGNMSVCVPRSSKPPSE